MGGWERQCKPATCLQQLDNQPLVHTSDPARHAGSQDGSGLGPPAGSATTRCSGSCAGKGGWEPRLRIQRVCTEAGGLRHQAPKPKHNGTAVHTNERASIQNKHCQPVGWLYQAPQTDTAPAADSAACHRIPAPPRRLRHIMPACLLLPTNPPLTARAAAPPAYPQIPAPPPVPHCRR